MTDGGASCSYDGGGDVLSFGACSWMTMIPVPVSPCHATDWSDMTARF
jgi:hypothetical protein